MKLTPEKKAVVDDLRERFGSKPTRKQIKTYVKEVDPGADPEYSSKLPRWLLNNKKFRYGRGVYDLDLVEGLSDPAVAVNVAAKATTETASTPEVETTS